MKLATFLVAVGVGAVVFAFSAIDWRLGLGIGGAILTAAGALALDVDKHK